MDIAVSIFVKENTQAEVRLSLRSKGSVNVSKIAQSFGGGGHVTAAGFKCVQGIEEVMENTLKQVIKKVEAQLAQL
jgi:phosphoesterase RecJ-like protein